MRGCIHIVYILHIVCISDDPPDETLIIIKQYVQYLLFIDGFSPTIQQFKFKT